MRVFLSGGGTAGHVYPALAVAATLAAEHDHVTYIGTPGGLEARLVPEAGVAFRGLASRGFDRSKPLSLLIAVVMMFGSMLRAWWWLGREHVDVVMGFGGYVSLPVGLAAALRRIPLVLHEQNSVPGLANRVLAKWATSIGITYEDSAALLPPSLHVEISGNPVRAQILTASRERGREALGVPPDALMLLVFGGSRGARHLNQSVVSMRDTLMALDGLYVVQVAGPLEASSVRETLGESPEDRWKVYEYISEMGDVIAAADLVVSRAGATTIAELTALGVPSIVVPYPYATDDHQTKNAATLVAHGAAVVVPDSALDEPAFAEQVVGLLEDPGLRANMAAASRALARTDAAEHLADMAHRAGQA